MYHTFIYIPFRWQVIQSPTCRAYMKDLKNLDELRRSKIDVHCLRQSETKNTINQTVASEMCAVLQKQTRKTSCVFQSDAESVLQDHSLVSLDWCSKPVETNARHLKQEHACDWIGHTEIYNSCHFSATVIVIFLALLNWMPGSSTPAEI